MKIMGKKSRDTVPLKGRRHKICIHNVSFTNPSGSLIRKLRVFSNIVSIYTRRISWQKFKKTDSAVSMIIQSVVSIFEYWNPRIKNPIRKFVDTWIRAQMDYCNKNRRKMSHDTVPLMWRLVNHVPVSWATPSRKESDPFQRISPNSWVSTYIME